MSMEEQFKFLLEVSKRNFKDFLHFIAIGLLAVCVNFFTRIVFSMEFNFFISVLLSQCIGMIFAFYLFKNYLFKSSKRSFQLLKFLMVNLLSLLIILIISHTMAFFLLPAVGILKFKYEIAHFIGIGSTAFTSFILHKYWTFS